jgi:hypothetical protein
LAWAKIAVAASCKILVRDMISTKRKRCMQRGF